MIEGIKTDMFIERRYVLRGQKVLWTSLVGLVLAFGIVPAAFADGEAPSLALDLREGDAPDVCNADVPQVRVTVNGVRAFGILTVEVYGDDKKNFLSKEGRLRRTRVAAGNSPQTVCVNVDGAGTYAVAAYHDLNADRKLGRKWNFLPKEPFALSNDPKLKLRKPRHHEAAFEAGALGADITVNLRGSDPDA